MRKKRDPEKMPRWSLVLYAIAALALVLYLVAMLSTRFANAYNGTVGAALRAVLAFLTSWMPFSLAEILLYSLPLVVVLLTVLAYRGHCDTWRAVFVFLGSVVSVFSLLFSLFVFGFGTGYHTDTLDTRLGLEKKEVDAQALAVTAERLVAELNALAGEMTYNGTGFSVMPYDLKELNARLLDAYEPVCEKHAFIQNMNSRIKPVLASKAMSYTHVTGVYSYFTGEANVNTYFPDYTLPYTAAHELAHQRGIARENEANFVAFLVCASSEDSYIRYCGYLNLFEYVGGALHATDAERFRAIRDTLDVRVLDELRAYSAFFDEFRDSVAADVSDTVNDTYLKLNGNKAGSGSYGLVVELAVAYYHTN